MEASGSHALIVNTSSSAHVTAAPCTVHKGPSLARRTKPPRNCSLLIPHATSGCIQDPDSTCERAKLIRARSKPRGLGSEKVDPANAANGVAGSRTRGGPQKHGMAGVEHRSGMSSRSRRLACRLDFYGLDRRTWTNSNADDEVARCASLRVIFGTTSYAWLDNCSWKVWLPFIRYARTAMTMCTVLRRASSARTLCCTRTSRFPTSPRGLQILQHQQVSNARVASKADAGASLPHLSFTRSI